MPVKKKNNRKNTPQYVRDDAIVPKKGEVGKKPIPKIQGKRVDLNPRRVTALSTAGKKKRPK